MNTRTLVVFSLVISLLASFVSFSITYAQPPTPPGKQPPPDELYDPIGEKASAPTMMRDTSLSSTFNISGTAAASEIISFRFVRTFGQTEVAYFANTTHLNYPYGIGIGDNAIWIAEQWGNRILKYTNNGAFQIAFGCPRMPDNCWEDTYFLEVVDVTTDSEGNVWVVDDGQNRVIKLDPSGHKVLALGELGVEGDDNQHFRYPISVAFDSRGNIYVSDGSPFWTWDGNNRIQIFNPDGTYRSTIHINSPRHIAIYQDHLYIPQAEDGQVTIYNVSDLDNIQLEGAITGLRNPSGVAIDANYIYVADTSNHQVQVYNRNTREKITTIGNGWGTTNDQFKHPTDVAVDTSGNLFVADWVNTRVQQFTKTESGWAYTRTYGVTGIPYVTDAYLYNNPSGVAIASDGSIYLTEDYGHRLVKLNAQGVPIWTKGQPGVKGDWDDSNEMLNNPDDVDVDAYGRVYVADRWHGRVQIYTADGQYEASITGLSCPGGIGIAPNNGDIYVADTCNHSVEIYNANRDWVATLGIRGEPGNDNAHFNSPEDVAIDNNGTIYVSDKDNHRVQVFNANRQFIRTIGETSVGGNDFYHLNGPNNLAVDHSGHLYVADANNDRVQVFDRDGNYLTTIGGSWGTNTGQLRWPRGVAVDRYGNVYVADSNNHRIQKFALGVPGWRQVNINGFGDRMNTLITSLIAYGDHLYAGVYNPEGAQIWRMDATGNWSMIQDAGLGNPANVGIDHMIEFNGCLYAGTWADEINGGELWRTCNGTTWEKVVGQGFGDPTNGEIMRLGVYNGQIYAATWSYTADHGAEIWRSSNGELGSWEKVVSNGLGERTNTAVVSLETFNNALYVGLNGLIGEGADGAEIWRYDGTQWTEVTPATLADGKTYAITLKPFNNYLYAGAGRYDLDSNQYPGAQIWRCSQSSGCDENNDWELVLDQGFNNNPFNTRIDGFQAYGGCLYAITSNSTQGMEIWYSCDGVRWTPKVQSGFGDSNNLNSYWGSALAIYQDNFYIGTGNYANGGEIWQALRQTFLPLVLR